MKTNKNSNNNNGRGEHTHTQTQHKHTLAHMQIYTYNNNEQIIQNSNICTLTHSTINLLFLTAAANIYALRATVAFESNLIGNNTRRNGSTNDRNLIYPNTHMHMRAELQPYTIINCQPVIGRHLPKKLIDIWILLQHSFYTISLFVIILKTITMVEYIKIMEDPRQHIIKATKQLKTQSKSITALYVTFICASLLFVLCLKIMTLNNVRQREGEQLHKQRLVCYLTTSERSPLSLLAVPGDLCTHINIGAADLVNTTLQLSAQLTHVLANETNLFRARHPQVKLLLWIGGADSGHQFAQMVANHAKRKNFLRSVKAVLHKYPSLDGIDLDWEFPSAYDKEVVHFCQLFYEIRLEWQREKRERYLLTLAVAAPEGIAFFAYNIREINLYVDYVNLMTYDFHFYRKDMPFTGLNAPLYARPTEKSIMGTFNINYTVHWWLRNGLEPHRLVIGLPTYGHSFRLVNPFNTRIGAPASGYGQCGALGFTTLSETCDCVQNYLSPKVTYDEGTCSPYLSALEEWISYESKTSMQCKANYVKSLNVGGIMIFALNMDDLRNTCGYIPSNAATADRPVFPLIQTARAILGGRKERHLRKDLYLA